MRKTPLTLLIVATLLAAAAWRLLPSPSRDALRPMATAINEAAPRAAAAGIPARSDSAPGPLPPAPPLPGPALPAEDATTLEARVLPRLPPSGKLRAQLSLLGPGARLAALRKLEEMTVIDESSTLIDENGGVCRFCPAPLHGLGMAGRPADENLAGPPPVAAAPISSARAPVFHSRPTATNRIVLNFSGGVVTGTAWNNNGYYGNVASWTCLPYDRDGDATTFSDAEQQQIRDIWERVAEDFAPFNVDVTTEPPAAFTNTTLHVFITKNFDRDGRALPAHGAGGVSFQGYFGAADYAARWNIGFSYYPSLYTTIQIAENISHEIGHQMGLSHNGTTNGVEYYAGHGSGETGWQPIMGNSYTLNVTQWSKGEYERANNPEDQLAKIAAKLGYLGDQGLSVAAALPLTATATGHSGSGTIKRSQEAQHWALPVIASDTEVRVQPKKLSSLGQFQHTDGGNLHCAVELLDANGRSLSSHYSATGRSVTLNLPPGGPARFLKVAGAGARTPATGYSSYASVGQYEVVLISGTAPSLLADLASREVSFGGALRLSVNAAGTAPLRYEWTKDGTTLAGATSSTLDIPRATLAEAGTYQVRVSNALGSATSAAAVVTVATLTVTSGSYQAYGGSNPTTTTPPPPSAPVIVTPPGPVEALGGSTVRLAAEVTGEPRPTLQWYREGQLLAGMTLSGLQIAPLTAELTGEYTIVAVNRLGRASSTVPVRILPGNVLPNAQPITSGAFQAFATPQNQAPGIPGVTPPSRPTFILSPRAAEAVVGSTVQLDAVAAGFPRPTFQWYKDGRPIAGMTQAGLRVGPLAPELGGAYVVVATNGSGQAVSEPAQVTLISAPVISRQPAGTTLREGERLRLEVIAAGTAPLSYQWARDGQPIAGAVASVLDLPGVSRTNAGVYTVDIRNSAGSVRSEPAVLTVQTKPALTNLSVRTTLAAGQIVTVGAVVEGAAKRVLARAGGPALQQFGLRGTPDPKLELYLRGASPAAANDDWSATLATSFAAVGAFAFPSGSKDAALAQDLAGAFTVQARGTDPGAVLVELYDLGDAGSGRFVNVSVRNRVGTGPDVLIAGLAIGGTGTMNVLIRAIGPGLQPFGVSGTLVDPRLQVHDRTGAAVASNEDWSAALSPTFATTGAFALPANSKDAALLASLRAGETYTVIVSGADGGTGEALIEIYALP